MNDPEANKSSNEARLAAREARWDATIPTLATKADVAELRADMHKWMTGTCIGLFVGFGGLFLAISNKSPPAPSVQLQPIIIAIPAMPTAPPAAL
jgi:hypothetical protein